MTGWAHPLGRIPEVVDIVALGPSRADFTARLSHHDTPDVTDEVWAVNTAFRWIPADIAWIMDDMREYAWRHPTYGKAMRDARVPIMTSAGAAYPEFPTAIGYPLAQIVTHFQSTYFRNSIPYMVAYATWIGVKKLRLYGADYTYDGNQNREEGHVNLAFWVGIAKAHGVAVEIARNSSLLQTNEPLWFYGPLRQPRVVWDEVGRMSVEVLPITESVKDDRISDRQRDSHDRESADPEQAAPEPRQAGLR